MSTKLRSYWFHYNKPASKKAGEPRLTFHWKGECKIVKGVYIYSGPVKTRNKKTQPRCVMSGKAASVEFINHTAVVQ